MKEKKQRTINLEAFYVTFKRRNTDRVIAEFEGETAKEGRYKIKAEFNFSCLPYLMPQLRQQWEEARGCKEREIDRINKSLGL